MFPFLLFVYKANLKRLDWFSKIFSNSFIKGLTFNSSNGILRLTSQSNTTEVTNYENYY